MVSRSQKPTFKGYPKKLDRRVKIRFLILNSQLIRIYQMKLIKKKLEFQKLVAQCTRIGYNFIMSLN